MAAKNKVSAFWNEWKQVIGWAGAALFLWKWVLPAIGFGGASNDSNTSSGGSGSVLDMVKTDFTAAVRKVTTSALDGATAADLTNLRADANTLAEALGTKAGTSLLDQSTWVEDEDGAVKVLKRYRSFVVYKGKKIPKKSKYTYRGIEGFYNEITKGRSVEADCRKYITGSAYNQILTDVFG